MRGETFRSARDPEVTMKTVLGYWAETRSAAPWNSNPWAKTRS